MSPDGKVRVFVRSHKVPIRTVEVREPIFSTSGVFMGTRRSQRVVYGSAMCEDYRRAIEEGRKLCCNLDLEFEVVDSGKSGFLRRAISSLRPGNSARPVVVISPPLLVSGPELSHPAAHAS